MHEIITSTKNVRIKQILSLQKASERKKQGLFVVEGIREVMMAIKSGFILHSLYYCNELIQNPEINRVIEQSSISESCIQLGSNVYSKVAYRGSSEGVLAIFYAKKTSITDLVLPDNPLILIAESVEKPGNLGAILRTADAAGVSAVIFCDSITDIYNPNVIRSSLGGVFSNQIVIESSKNLLIWLKKRGIKIYSAAITPGSLLYYKVDYTGPTAIIFGSESAGLSSTWLNGSDCNIIIPMTGEIDSLNVSASAAIIVFEAIRQRSII